MVKSRINSILLITLFALLLSAVLSLISVQKNAYALDDTVRIFPYDGYVQLNSADLICANGDYIASADKAAKKVVVIGNTTNSFTVESDIDGIYLSGDLLIVKCGDTLCKADLTLSSPALSPFTLSAPSGYSYIASNGDCLFTHVLGTVTIYSSDLSTYESRTDSVFAGTPVTTFDAENVYIFSDEYGQSKFSVFNMADGSLKKVNSTVSAQGASCGNYIFVYDKVLSSLLAVNKVSGAVVFDTDINSKNFASYGDKLFIAAGKNGILEYSVNADSTDVELSKSYSYSGSSLSLLDSPSDVAFYDNKTVIADTGNNRILFIDDQTTTLNCVSPKKIVAGGRKLYAVSDHSVYAFSADSLTSYTFADETILDIAYADGIYVLTTRGICTFAGGKLQALCSLNNGISLASASENYIYALTQNGIDVFSTNGIKADFLSVTLSSAEMSNCTDFAVDYTGNLYLSYSDGRIIKKYWQNNCALVGVAPATPLADETYTVSGCEEASINSLTLGLDGFAYFTATQNLLGKIDVNAETKSQFTPTAAPSISNSDAVTVYSKGSTDAFFMEDMKIADSAQKLNVEDTFYAFDTTVSPNVKYGVFKGIKGYLLGGCEASVTNINHDYVALNDVPLYLYPGAKEAFTLQKDTIINVLNDAANAESGKWFCVQWEGKTYFAERSSFEIYIQPTIEPNNTEGTFARAKASRAGGSVKLYSAPNEASEVLKSLSDGTKLIVIESMDGYCLVSVGDITGYIKADEVQYNGLTTVQIVAIVLSVLVLASGVVIFLVTYVYKKRSADSE